MQQRKFFFGKNQMPDVKAATLLELLWGALGDTTLVILMISAVVSIALGATLSQNTSVDWIEGVAILLAVFTVATVTAVTDSQKESQFRELQAKQVFSHLLSLWLTHHAQTQSNAMEVIRNGQQLIITSHELVVCSLCSNRICN